MYKQKEFDFGKYKAFFAFSNEQLEEAKKRLNIGDNEKLVDMNMGGLICVKSNAKEMLKAFDEHNKREAEKRKQIDGKEKIIRYELGNYEAYYTGNLRDTIEAVKEYGYTEKDVLEIYNKTKDEYIEKHGC